MTLSEQATEKDPRTHYGIIQISGQAVPHQLR
jgi:hypothetical protein